VIVGLYVVRHHFKAPIDENDESARQMLEVNREFGVDWVRSYYSHDGAHSVCVYEAPSAEVLREHALCLGLPVEEVLPVVEVLPPRV
jgi:hypothetical protein